MQDAGVYECIATSPRGTVSQQIHVHVKGKDKTSLFFFFIKILLDSNTYHKLEQVRWSSRYGPNEYREVNEIAR